MERLKRWCIDAFPAPGYLTMPAAALDISPNSVKYLDGAYTAKGCLPGAFDEVFLPEGTIQDGVLANPAALRDALQQLQRAHKKKFVFVAIPENALYLYTLHIQGRPTQAAIKHQVEFSFKEHVPLTLEDALYDFDIVSVERGGTLVSVTVAPRDIIASYEQVLHDAHFTPRAIELEAYAVARAVSHPEVTGVEMIVDLGFKRAGIIILKNGLPIFTITSHCGSQCPEEVADEARKQYTFWDTRTNEKGKRIERVSQVSLCGGAADLERAALLSDVLGTPVEMANVWQNLFHTDDHIPMIDADEALSMATLAGLLMNNKT